VNVILTAQNSTQIALSSVKDKLTANVKLLGTPISGATVNFTTNSLNAVLTASVATTDGSGNAVSYISDPVAENVLVSAYFSNSTSNTIVQFLPAVCFTFSVGAASPSANALTIDGVGYASFPQNLCYAQGSSHSYSFASTVAGSAGIQYAFSSASGCGASGQSGTIVSTTNCTLTATYTTQYQLTTSSSPGAGGTATPSTQYYNSGTQVTLGETPNGGYFFLSWTGSGTGSFSGNTAAPTIGINGVITQQANFYSTSTTTTTSTSTTSTSTTTTVPANPTCGSYTGDAVYSAASTTLSCNVIASNAIIVNSGSTLFECNFYLQGNVAVYDKGNITDTCAGGAGGGVGAAGSAGSSRTSNFLSTTLTGGTGGHGSSSTGSGSAGGACDSCYGYNQPGASGVSGGNGGGIVEIYAGNFINTGIVYAAGKKGQNGNNGSAGGGTCGCASGICTFGAYSVSSSGTSGSAGGNGGNGGKIFIGYINTLTIGTTSVAGGAGGAGSSGGAGMCAASGGSGAAGSAGSVGAVTTSVWSN